MNSGPSRDVALVARALGVTPEFPPVRRGQPKVAITGHAIVYLAGDDSARRRIHREGARLLWAARNGIPVPEVLDQAPNWLVTRRVPDDPKPDGPALARAAAAITAAIANATEPPPGPLVAVPSPFRGTARAAARLARWESTALAEEFLRLHRVVTRLPRTQLAHGDFHLKNLLYDAKERVLRVIDWEFVTYAPTGLDVLMLWARLGDPKGRAELIRKANNGAVTATTALWAAERYLADLNAGRDRRVRRAGAAACVRELIGDLHRAQSIRELQQAQRPLNER